MIFETFRVQRYIKLCERQAVYALKVQKRPGEGDGMAHLRPDKKERLFYIRAFCLSPAPLPRYFERGSLNFHVRSRMKVRRAGLLVARSMFAAVRWWNTCPTADKGYAYPDRRMQALLYLVPTNCTARSRRRPSATSSAAPALTRRRTTIRRSGSMG